MANTYKDIIIYPSRGSNAADPNVSFRGANSASNTEIVLRVYPDSNGILSFEGSAGQLFSITNQLTGTIFSVNDVSGIPSFQISDTGDITLAQYSGNVAIGVSSATSKLQIGGGIQTPMMWTNFSSSNYSNYNEGIRLYSADNGCATITFNTAGSGGSSYSSILGLTDRQERRWGGSWQDRLWNGYMEASGSYRAPIFYDSDDTGYYLNPASTGTSLNLAGCAYIGKGIISGSYYLTLTHDQLGAQGTLYLQYSSSGNINMCHGGGYAYSETSLRAPVFYDSDDTGYYLNPASSTISLFSNGIVSAGTGTSGGFQNKTFTAGRNRIWSFGNADTYGISYFQGGPDYIGLHFGTATQAASQFWVSDSGISQTSGSSRAPIFYDSDNTGYYVDPNSTSNIATIYADNWYRSYNSTGWYNSSYSGGIYMADTTWVRVYNSKAFYVDNLIAATGNITAYYSDERLKTKTGKIENALQKVLGLDGFHYVENELAKSLGYSNSKQQVGLSAQQVQSVLPEAVSLAPVDMHTDEFSGEITSKSGENYLTVDYSRLVPLLVEAIKQQQVQIDKLNSLVGRLSNETLGD